MSMGSLSTEIDENVIKRLPQSALSSISKTSKYYRTLSEPSLYESIVLGETETTAVACFFRTLLDRKYLAKYIKAFTMNEHEASDARTSHRTCMHQRCRELWKSRRPFKT